MSQRILSGKWKGQILAGSVGAKTRPTTSMMRQAIFNIWSELVEGSRFLDLFAGSGALAFEALSLEAKQVILVERDRMALIGIKKSLEKLKIERNEMIILRSQDVKIFLESKPVIPFDLIYADPPYDWRAQKDLLPGYYVAWLLSQLSKWARVGTRVMIEQERHVKEIIPQKLKGFCHLESRLYGDSMIHHFEFLHEQSTEPAQGHL